MAQFVLDLISKITENENIPRCFKLCEIEQFSELIEINESTLDQMEIYIQKRCLKMPFSERSDFIGNNFAKDPNYFKFSPGIRLKILNITEIMRKFFDNKTVPISLCDVKELCKRLEADSNIKNFTVPKSIMEQLLHSKNIREQLMPISQISNPPEVNELAVNKITQSDSIKKPIESYTNIFQRMDLLRKELKINEKIENNVVKEDGEKSSLDNIKNNFESNSNKMDINESSPKKALKRIIESVVENQQPDENQYRKLRRHSLRIAIANQNVFDDSSKAQVTERYTHISTRLRSRQSNNKNIDSADILNQQKVQSPPRVKRKYTKRSTNPDEVPISDNVQKSPSKIISIESLPDNPINTENHQENDLMLCNSDKNSTNTSKSVPKLSVNVDETISKLPNSSGTTIYMKNITNVLVTSNSSGSVPIKSITSQNSSMKIPVKSMTSKNLPVKVSVKSITPHSPSVKISVKSITPQNGTVKIPGLEYISTNNKLTNNIPLSKPVSVLQHEGSMPTSNNNIQFQKPIQTFKLVKDNIVKSVPQNQCKNSTQMTSEQNKPKGSSRLKLSDEPFQCFDTNVNRKKQHKIVPTKHLNGMPKFSVNPISNQPKSRPSNQLPNPRQKKAAELPKSHPISYSFESNSENVIKNDVNSVAIPTNPSILEPVQVDATPVKSNNFKQLMDSSIDLSMNPQWTSTPYFNANRFINSTKHQKQISMSEESRTISGTRFNN